MTIPFEGKNMSRQPVQEPAIVGDNHHAARESFDCTFKRPERFYIQVIGWFVQQQQVGASLQ